MNEQLLFYELVDDQEIAVAVVQGRTANTDEGLRAELVITEKGELVYGTIVYVNLFEALNGVGSDTIIEWKKLLDPANREEGRPDDS